MLVEIMGTSRNRVINTAVRPRYRVAGFTLIELLVTIAIASILASLAVPSFRGFIAGQSIKTASFDIMSTLSMARSEAIKRNANVTVDSDGQFFTVTTIDPATSATLTLQKQEVPAGVIFTGGGAVVYGGNGRLASAFTPVQISSTASTSVRCISIDLSGRPNSKKGAC